MSKYLLRRRNVSRSCWSRVQVPVLELVLVQGPVREQVQVPLL
jgi:hypothetical protein